MDFPIATEVPPTIASSERPTGAEGDMPGISTDHAGLETLPLDACLHLLASVPLGRIAFWADGQDVVFRTASGSKLTAACEQHRVTFEADSYDEQTRSGWSVLVTGRATPVYEEAEIERLGVLGLDPWPTAVGHPYWIRVRPTSITGRRTRGTVGAASERR